MRAYIVDTSAPAGVRATEVPDPQATASQATIAVEAFSLNHGELPKVGIFTPGTVPGWDAAGRVVEAAVDGTGPPVGARVLSQGHGGAWATLRAVETSALAVVPDVVSAEAASALPVAAGTALRALRSLGGVLGRRVLVTGASGGVGRFAVRLAYLAGAEVVALSSSAAKHDELRSLGAHEAVTSLAGLAPVFGVLENVGGPVLVEAFRALAPGGVLASIGSASGESAVFPPYATVGPPRSIVSFSLGTPAALGETLGEDFVYLLSLVATKRLDPQVTWTADWSRLGEALGLLEARRISGKAVLHVG